jgi:flagellar hook protein FlgE
MGLTTALYTGLSGLNANQLRINTIGHNIANVNTTAFKSSRALFQSQFSHTISPGTAPSDASGGVNPTQIGLGTVLGTIQRNFNAGSIETTGIPSDLAIEGSGLFVLRKGESQQVYTRDGAFIVGPDNKLLSADGHRVQGFAVDQGFNIVPGVLGDLEIPLGTQTVARATENVRMDGDLSAIGIPATESSVHMSQALTDAGGATATTGTALTALRSADDPNIALFAADTTITVSRVTKGERELPGQTFVVGTTGDTLGDFASWLQGALGISTESDLPGQPGVTVENGMLAVRGNAGEQNDLTFSVNDIASDNQAAPNPLALSKSQDATGSSVYTSMTAYDSLGTPVAVNLTMALESTTDAGPIWRFYAESPDSSGGSRVLGTGTISFDNEGNFLSATGTQVSLDRSNSGAATPLAFTLDFSQVHGLSTRNSAVILADQDGYSPGTLTNYGIQTDGTITGTFDNGLSRTLGQIALATFDNPEGLIADTDNTFLVGPNADPPTITTAGQFGAGRVLAGSLEASNVDLSNEFIGLVTSSTGFQAASRVITVSSDLLNQLLLIAR